jgi:hypothetical protein
VYLAITVCQVNRATPLGAMEWVAGVVTGLLFLSTIVSGGLVSIDKAMPAAIPIMHKVLP